MNITTQDGRSFSGTPLQIIKQMQSLSFGQQKAPLRHYVHWLIENTKRCDEIQLNVPAANDSRFNDEQVAAELLAELARTKLLQVNED